MYAIFVTDEANFLRTQTNGLQRTIYCAKVMATKITKALGLFLNRQEPIKQ